MYFNSNNHVWNSKSGYILRLYFGWMWPHWWGVVEGHVQKISIVTILFSEELSHKMFDVGDIPTSTLSRLLTNHHFEFLPTEFIELFSSVWAKLKGYTSSGPTCFLPMIPVLMLWSFRILESSVFYQTKCFIKPWNTANIVKRIKMMNIMM